VSCLSGNPEGVTLDLRPPGQLCTVETLSLLMKNGYTLGHEKNDVFRKPKRLAIWNGESIIF
jgi:hypothetical protein